MNQKAMQIRIGKYNTFVEFEMQEFSPIPEPIIMPIFYLSCRVQWGEYSGYKQEIPVWLASIEDFISKLQQLETTRQGIATLTQMGFENVEKVKSPFTFKIFSIDVLGHMAIGVEMIEAIGMGNKFKTFENSIAVNFEVDTSALPMLLADFKELLSRIKDSSGTIE